MTVQQRSFQIIPCPMGLSSPHTHLVVSGRGVPHEPLTLFYEELQKRCAPATLHVHMDLLLSFFSFLEEQQSLCEMTPSHRQEEWSSCMEAIAVPPFPAGMAWAGPPSQLQAAVRFYLAARWGCHTRQQGRYEDVLLSPSMEREQQIHLFLAVLRQFYRLAMERRDYWYESNPVEAFRLPLRSRLMQAITPIRLSLWSCPAVNRRKAGEAIREKPINVGRKLVASL